jgi:hypothetical protein
MSAADIVTMMEEYESLAKDVQSEYPVPAYYIRLYYLTQALNKLGVNKSSQFISVRKHCSA